MATETIVACPQCGAKNRVTDDQRRQTPVCGRCKTPLPLDRAATPLPVTDATFADLVERSPIPVLVDFWAPWCGPCRMIAPTIDALAAEFAGRVSVAKLNTDENQLTAGRYRIEGIPTMILFKGGREIDRIVGMAQKPEIARRMTAAIG